MKFFYKSNRFKGWLKPLATLFLILTFFLNVNAQSLSNNGPKCVGQDVTISFNAGSCSGITSITIL